MSDQHISLSPAEWQIMEHLWEKHPRTLMELVRTLAPQTGWSKSTIVTMIGRLENKGALTYTEGGRARLYSPTVTREQAAVQETNTLLHRLYRGSVAMMVNTIADGRGLSSEDIDELYAILQRARVEQKEDADE
ncbi:MAG: BlaI/MecI/CopY family transcriptional regulator [Oscillospiraceae bacterium]|nr:BlaI/MecI/CopY family transcriptional regulator [Oscillospiraceae bacterium]